MLVETGFHGGIPSLNFRFLLGNFGTCIKKKKMVMLLFEGLIGCPQECRNEKGFSPGLAGDELFWG